MGEEQPLEERPLSLIQVKEYIWAKYIENDEVEEEIEESLILDFFGGPIAIFWPLTNLGYGLNIGVTVNQQSVIPAIQPHITLVTEQILVPNVVTNASAVTTESIAIALLLLAVILLTQPIKKLTTEE